MYWSVLLWNQNRSYTGLPAARGLGSGSLIAYSSPGNVTSLGDVGVPPMATGLRFG